MRNIYLFLLRNSVLILFLILQSVSLYSLFNFNRFHESALNMVASNIAGAVYRNTDKVESYLSLQSENNSLREQNARLLSLMPSGNVLPDTGVTIVSKTFRIDSTSVGGQFQFLPARIISNSVFLQQNYMIIHRGREQGIEPNLAVVAPDGIIGTVVGAGANMSTVMSLLHRNSRVSAMLKKDNNAGSIEWDGASPYYLLLRNVSKGAKVVKGDTVVTSTYSANFPPYQVVGRVAEIEADPSSNFYTLKIKTAVNFFTVQFVYLVENLRYQEQFDLENSNSKTRE